MRKLSIISVFLVLGYFNFSTAIPQRSGQTPAENPDILNIVADIFKDSPQQQPTAQQTNLPATPTPQRGFGTFVTPVPDASGSQIDFLSKSGKNPQCTCVEYHKCDPETNLVTDDGTFDLFTQVDLRFGAEDDTPVCDHPLDVCCPNNMTHDTSLAPRKVEERPNRSKGCGIRNVGGIDFNLQGANDNEAGYGEFPWTAALLHGKNFSYFCAGSLIHPRVILTAAHCVVNRQPSSFIVRAGEWDTQTMRERVPYEERNVQRVITHPQYNPRSVANNFALIILTEAFTLADHINVICLPTANATPAPRTTCFATGWGKDLFGAAGRFNVIMKRVPLPIVARDTCQNQLRGTRLGPKFVLDNSYICAGGERGIDTCEGDGGAPLVCPIGLPDQNRYTQSGIVAWGIGCNDQVPAAYSNVALARNWIDEQMLANGFPTSSYSPQ